MLRYLVDPIFQVINTAGKPATGGYIEVYLHGTRDKYYCASDFNGTLHPFKIPLDSLGANIILADDANAYDIYVYNRYGSLLMSRYNVAPVQGGGSEGGDHIGKVHFLKAVSDDLADMRAPYSFWIVDLEKPNPQSTYGYDYAMADEIIAKLSAGEVFVLSTYPTAPSAEEDLYIMGSSALQTWQGHTAVRIWFTRMFAANSPEYMYFTTIYTPSMYNNNPMAGGYPEGRMAILNWRGQQDSRSEFHFMPYTELSEVATTGNYNDLNNKPTIPAAQVQSDWSQSDNTKVDYIKNKPNLALKENVSNKVQTINDTSTTDYPSSKAVADFVNSSVATNTANFLGTLSESSLGLDYTATNAQIALELNVHSWDSPPTNNDYCFVSVNDPQTTDVDEYRRFKFNGSVWAYEYTLNNSIFTQAQWNAINSGIDSSDKSAYDAAVTLLSNHVNDHSNPHNVTAAQIGAESVSNKSSTVDPTSETEYPSCAAVAGFVNGSVATSVSKIAEATVNVHHSDSNTDTSSFVFVNNHIYHLTVSLIGSGFSINTSSSGLGYILAYIGSSAAVNHYSVIQNVNIQQGVITTNDIRLPIDWRAENITGSSDNKLHIVVRFNNNWYSLAQSNYELTLDGTDLNGDFVLLNGVRYDNRFYEINSDNVGSTFVDAVRLPSGYEKLGRVWFNGDTSIPILSLIVTDYDLPENFGNIYTAFNRVSNISAYQKIFSTRFIDNSYKMTRVINDGLSNRLICNVNTNGNENTVFDDTKSLQLTDDNRLNKSLIHSNWINTNASTGTTPTSRKLEFLSSGTLTYFRFLFVADGNRQVTFTAIPCKHGSDYGLYDVVAGKFYTHADLTGD